MNYLVPTIAIITSLCVLWACWTQFVKAEQRADDEWWDSHLDRTDWTHLDAYQLREDQIEDREHPKHKDFI